MREPIANKIANFWKTLTPTQEYVIFWLTSILITLIQQLLEGVNWRDAVLAFLGSFLIQVNAMGAIKKVATRREEEADETPEGITE
jgi:hypothetical protein